MSKTVDIDRCKSVLPMPDLMASLGMSGNCNKKAHCPWHDDKTTSFSVFQNEGKWYFKCFAGCASGDEINLIEKHTGKSRGDAIRYYAELAGLSESEPMTAGKFRRLAHDIFNATETIETQPQAQGKGKASGVSAAPGAPAVTMNPLTDRQIKVLAKKRGYPVEFVEAIAMYGMVGTIKIGKSTHWAFPTKGGFHYRAADESWRYTAGAKPSLYEIGEIHEGAHVHCFESQWDALAYASSLEDLERNNIVATRGAGNVKLIAERFKNYSGVLYLWPQNDAPGEKWANDIREALPDVQMRVVRLNPTYKDLNEWLKMPECNPGEFLCAIRNAPDFPAPVLAEPPKQNYPARSARPDGEARESTNPEYSRDSRGGKNDFEQSVTESAEPSSPDNAKTGADETISGPTVSNDRASASPSVSDEVKTGNSVASDKAAATDEARESQQETLESERLTNAVEQPEPDIKEPVSVQSPTSEAAAPLAEILDDISAFLKRYVIFPDEEAQATATALWVAHAWTYKSFKFTPYLNVNSPEKRCGKTRLLECLQLLVPKPQSFVRPTEAVLFRTIAKHKPTLLLDEIDTVYSAKEGDEKSEGIRAVLNAGFQDGPFALIPRCVGKDNEPELFDTYCPKVIAGIGKNLPDTVRDRSIEIRLVRQTKEKQAARFRAESAKTEVEPIVAALMQWANENREALTELRPEMPQQLSDRQQDMMEPLLAIADMAGGDWPDRGRAAMIALGAITEDASIGVQLLASCRQVFHATNRSKLTSSALLGYLIEIEDANAPWATYWEGDYKHGKVHAPARSLAKLLEPFGIQPKAIRLPDGEVAKGYYKNDFMDAWRRYLSPVKAEETMELGL